MDKDIEIYKDYLIAKHDPDVTVTSVAVKHGITRNGLYELVRRIEHGNVTKIRHEMKRARLEIYNKYKYQPRLMALPKNRKPETVVELKKIINIMAKDGFGASEIAEMTGKERPTILHHLEK